MSALKNIFTIFLMGILTTSLAKAAVKLTDGRGRSLGVEQFTAKESWYLNPAGLYSYGVLISFVGDEVPSSIVSAEGAELISVENKKTIFLSALKSTFLGKDGNVVLNSQWVPEKKGILYTNCQTKFFSFRLDRKNERFDFPIALRCDLEGVPPRFSISVPSDVEWVDYTWTEVAGKGERTRMFELPSGGLTADTEGEFIFRKDKQLLKLPIVIRKLGEDEAERLRTTGLAFAKTLAVGSTNLSYSAGATSASAQSFLLRFKGLSDPFFKSFRFGLNIKNTFNMSDDPNSITLTDLGMGLGYYWNFAKSWDVGVGSQYRYLDYRHLASEGRLQSSQFSVFGAGAYTFGSNKLVADVSMANLGSKIVQSHMDMSVGYARLISFWGAQTWLGLEYEMQTTQGADEAGASQQFDDMSIMLSLSF